MQTSNKNILIYTGLGLLIGFLVFTTIQTNKLLKEERARTSRYYDMYKKNQIAKDSLQAHTDSVEVILAKYKYLIDSLQSAVEFEAERAVYLNYKLEEVLAELQSTTYDDNYDYLQHRYPTEDTLEFPFAGSQVRRITEEVVTFDYTDSLLQSYIDVSILKQKQLDYKDEIIKTLEDENSDLNKLAQKLYDQLAVRQEDLQMSEEQLEKTKRALRLWQTGALSGGAFLVLLLFLL